MNNFPGSGPWLCKYLISELSSPTDKPNFSGCYVLHANPTNRSITIYDGHVKLQAILTQTAAHELDNNSNNAGLRNLVGKTLIPIQALVVPCLYHVPSTVKLVLQNVKISSDCIVQPPEREPECALIDPFVRNALNDCDAKLLAKSLLTFSLADADNLDETQLATNFYVDFKVDFPPQSIRLKTVPIPPLPVSSKSTLPQTQISSASLSKPSAAHHNAVSLQSSWNTGKLNEELSLHQRASLSSEPRLSHSPTRTATLDFDPTLTQGTITSSTAHVNNSLSLSHSQVTVRIPQPPANPGTPRAYSAIGNSKKLPARRQPRKNLHSHSSHINGSILSQAEDSPSVINENALVQFPPHIRSVPEPPPKQRKDHHGSILAFLDAPLRDDDVCANDFDDSEHENQETQQGRIESVRITSSEANKHASHANCASADKVNEKSPQKDIVLSKVECRTTDATDKPARVSEMENNIAGVAGKHGACANGVLLEIMDMPQMQHNNDSCDSDDGIPLSQCANKTSTGESAKSQSPNNMGIEPDDNKLLVEDVELIENVAAIERELCILCTLDTAVRDEIYDIALTDRLLP